MDANATYQGSNGHPVVAGSEASPSRSADRFDRQMSVRRPAPQSLIEAGSVPPSQVPESGARWLASCAFPRGFLPVRAAFPDTRAGRHPHHYFRGLLKLHTRYGL